MHYQEAAMVTVAQAVRRPTLSGLSHRWWWTNTPAWIEAGPTGRSPCGPEKSASFSPFINTR
jgi:hypothetical protein